MPFALGFGDHFFNHHKNHRSGSKTQGIRQQRLYENHSRGPDRDAAGERRIKSSTLRLISLAKNTQAAPRAVTPHVNNVAKRACKTGLNCSNSSKIVFSLSIRFMDKAALEPARYRFAQSRIDLLERVPDSAASSNPIDPRRRTRGYGRKSPKSAGIFR